MGPERGLTRSKRHLRGTWSLTSESFTRGHALAWGGVRGTGTLSSKPLAGRSWWYHCDDGSSLLSTVRRQGKYVR